MKGWSRAGAVAEVVNKSWEGGGTFNNYCQNVKTQNTNLEITERMHTHTTIIKVVVSCTYVYTNIDVHM